MKNNISIADLGPAEVLRRLYDCARPQGLGMLAYERGSMSVEESRQIIDRLRDAGRPLYFDYVKGRVLKVDLSGTHFCPRLYDRDNGFGAAERALTIKAQATPAEGGDA